METRIHGPARIALWPIVENLAWFFVFLCVLSSVNVLTSLRFQSGNSVCVCCMVQLCKVWWDFITVLFFFFGQCSSEWFFTMSSEKTCLKLKKNLCQRFFYFCFFFLLFFWVLFWFSFSVGDFFVCLFVLSMHWVNAKIETKCRMKEIQSDFDKFVARKKKKSLLSWWSMAQHSLKLMNNAAIFQFQLICFLI